MAKEEQSPVIPPPPILPQPPHMPDREKKSTQPPPSSLLSLEELERFKNLLVFAKSEVDGYFSGIHRSRFYGSSAEFSDYREYLPGEDAQRVDWRLYARTRKLFVRRFQEETDMVVYLLVDTSRSMVYRGEGRQPKFHLAAKIAAALSYLMIRQGDKTALALFSDRVTRYVPPGGTRRHLYWMISELERVRPASTTGLAHAVSDCHSIFKKRGRIVVLSDFLDEPEPVFEALGQFMHRDFDILLMQVLDPDELELPSVNMAKFVDMENGQQVAVEPEEIRRAYRERMHKFTDAIAHEANRRQIAYKLVDTQNQYLQAIEAYLGFRHGKRTAAG